MTQKALTNIEAGRFEPVINAHMLAQAYSDIAFTVSKIVDGSGLRALSLVNSSTLYIKPTGRATTRVDSGYVDSSLLTFLDALLSRFPVINSLTDTKTTAHELPDKEDIITMSISSIRERIAAPYSNRLVDRLNYLHEVSVDDFPEQEPMVYESLRVFIDFFDTNPALTEPDLVLSISGNVCAEWHCLLTKELLTVEFLPSGQVNYCVFALGSEKPVNFNRASGVVSANSLIKIVEPFNILPWIIGKS